MRATGPVEIRILVTERVPPSGVVVVVGGNADGSEQPFEGWLGLLHVLETVVG